MTVIPSIDIRSGSLVDLAREHGEAAKALIAASRRTLGPLSEPIGHFALPAGDRVSRDWLAKTGNPYLPEIDAIAHHLNTPGVYALNICFEWGCTSAVYGLDGGPMLTRVLDWVFPHLGEAIVVARQRGPAGEFHNVTWPGMTGMFHGLATGRFAASLNQAPMRRHRLTYAGDWLRNRRLVFRANALPPEHLLRQTFEQARDYEDAKRRLCHTPVAIPVIYTLAGIREGEGCAIERTEEDFAIREMDGDRVCAANQFDTILNVRGGWRPRPIDSAGRAHRARAVPLASIDDRFGWFQPPVANSHSRVVLTADAAHGALRVMGTNGLQPVTETFRLG